MDGSAAAPSYGLTREFIQCASATLTDHCGKSLAVERKFQTQVGIHMPYSIRRAEQSPWSGDFGVSTARVCLCH